jgi:hypothetical protein
MDADLDTTTPHGPPLGAWGPALAICVTVIISQLFTVLWFERSLLPAITGASQQGGDESAIFGLGPAAQPGGNMGAPGMAGGMNASAQSAFTPEEIAAYLEAFDDELNEYLRGLAAEYGLPAEAMASPALVFEQSYESGRLVPPAVMETHLRSLAPELIDANNRSYPREVMTLQILVDSKSASTTPRRRGGLEVEGAEAPLGDEVPTANPDAGVGN